MRFFASCLAVAMCLSMVDTSLFFPVNAEGETTPVEQAPDSGQTDPGVETQPEETVPAEGTEPETETPEPDIPAVEEQPVEPEGPVNDETVLPEEPKSEGEEENSGPEEEPIPSVMSVAALEANQDNSGWITRISVLDTEKNALNPDNIQSLKPGWVRESGVPESLTINGHTYTFKGVEVDGQPVLYTAMYEGEVFYSFDGASGKLLEAGKNLDIVYWEYFDVKLNNTGTGTGDFEFVTQKLEYPQGSGNTALKGITDTTLTSIDQAARIYKGMTFNWSVALHKDEATDSRYVINSITKNGVQLENAAAYKNGGSFSETIDTNTVFDLKVGVNTVVNVMFNSSALSSGPNPSQFKAPDETNPVKFKITRTPLTAINTIYIQTETERLAFSTDTSGAQENGGYSVVINKPRLLPPTYDISIQKKNPDGKPIPIYDDLVIYTDQDSVFSSITTKINDQNTFAAIYKNGSFSTLKNEDVHQLTNFLIGGTKSVLFFYKASPGYTPNCSFDGTLNDYSVINDSVEHYSNQSIAAGAKERGYTHYISITKTNWTQKLDKNLVFYSTAVDVQIVRNDTNGLVLDQIVNVTIADQPTVNLLANDLTPPTDGTVFAGYALNGNTDVLYPADSVFTVTPDTWSLGKLKNGVQTFTFTPQYHEPDSIYLIYHHRQKDNGEYDDTPDASGKYPETTVEVQTGVSPGTTGYVIGIPKEYEGYTFDAAKSQDTMGIQLKNGKPVGPSRAEIHLYYAKDIQYGHLSIHNYVEGDLANKNKPFSYQLIAKPTSANFPVDELTKNDFIADSDGTRYVKSVYLKHGESHSMQNLPITNCEYTVKLTTDDSFYTTSKAVKVNNEEVSPGEDSTSHTFTESSMTPNATHKVHFTHTASDVVPAGNIFEDQGFDLMLATTAVLGLLCAIYAILRRKLHA